MREFWYTFCSWEYGNTLNYMPIPLLFHGHCLPRIPVFLLPLEGTGAKSSSVSPSSPFRLRLLPLLSAGFDSHSVGLPDSFLIKNQHFLHVSLLFLTSLNAARIALRRI